MILIGLFLTTIFLVLSAIHIYWGFGGKWGTVGSIPTDDKGVRTMNPGPISCFVVAFGLLGFALLNLIRIDWLAVNLPSVITFYGLWIVSGIFLLRAIGDFKQVGFFKKIRQTRFGQLDTRYFSPLCLFIGLLEMYLASQ